MMTVMEARDILDSIDLQKVIDAVKDTAEWNRVFDALPSTEWDDAISALKLEPLLKQFRKMGFESLASIRELLLAADPRWNDRGQKFQDILKFSEGWELIVAPRADTSGSSKWDAFADSTAPEATRLRRF